jgi:prevent-host-death family protein
MSRERIVRTAAAASSGRAWKLEEAKARFSEVVRLAQSEGPQRVTVRGRETVVVVSVEELERLLPPRDNEPSLVPFLEGLNFDGLDLDLEMDRGRDVVL